jgi:hypothetical protein
MFYRKISVWAGVYGYKVSRVRVIDSMANCSYSAGYISVCVWIVVWFDGRLAMSCDYNENTSNPQK